MPAPDDVAQALARETGSQVQISGARAANALGLTTQVPARSTYLTDGPSRRVVFCRGFVLLAGQAAWRRAAAAVSERQGIPLVCHVVGAGDDVRDPVGRWPTACGVGPGGAVLIRPGGFVASRWPDSGNDAEGKLSEVLGRLALSGASKKG